MLNTRIQGTDGLLLTAAPGRLFPLGVRGIKKVQVCDRLVRAQSCTPLVLYGWEGRVATGRGTLQPEADHINCAKRISLH